MGAKEDSYFFKTGLFPPLGGLSDGTTQFKATTRSLLLCTQASPGSAKIEGGGPEGRPDHAEDGAGRGGPV